MHHKISLSALTLAAFHALQALGAPTLQDAHGLDTTLALVGRSDAATDAADMPAAVLRPVGPPASENPPAAAAHVVPQPSATLYYGSVPNTAPKAAVLTLPKLNYPAINAFAAAAITDVVCDGTSAKVTFANADAFNVAVDEWAKAGPFTLITFSATCGTGIDDATHDFILVKNVVKHTPGDLSINVGIQTISLEEAVGGDNPMSVKFGQSAVQKRSEDLAVRADNTDLATDFSKSLDKTIQFNKYISNTQSPFGAAYKLYSNDKLSVYCVGCGADALIAFHGELEFTWYGGYKSGKISVDGHMNAAVVFGLDGKLGVKIPIPETTLAQISLSSFILPGILNIGPEARIGAGGAIVVDAAGQLEAGVKLQWPRIQASVDIDGKSNPSGVSGWQPNIDPVFSAKGSINATLDAHLTAAVGFGISILNNKFSRSVELIDQPGVQVTGGIQGKASTTGGSLTGPCKGVLISAKIYNKLFANVLNIKQFDIFTWYSPALSRCLAL